MLGSGFQSGAYFHSSVADHNESSYSTSSPVLDIGRLLNFHKMDVKWYIILVLFLFFDDLSTILYDWMQISCLWSTWNQTGCPFFCQISFLFLLDL